MGLGWLLFFFVFVLFEHLGWHFGLPHRHPQHDGLIVWMAFWPSDPVVDGFCLAFVFWDPPLFFFLIHLPWNSLLYPSSLASKEALSGTQCS